MCLRPLAPAALLLAMLIPAAVAGAQTRAPEGPDSTREYWLGKSNILDQADPSSIRAQAVFIKVLAAADKRPGPTPELVILGEDGFPWARSLPDGTILLTRGALKIAFTPPNPEEGDARLAFILGHELSHQVNGDFWHFFFYQGVHPEEARDPKAKQTLQQVIKIAKASDSVSTKELQADQYGALYAAQAGYGMRAIVDGDKNFFREWTAATSPWLLQGIALDQNHPLIEERSAAVLLSLDRVLRKIEVFDKGIQAYREDNLSPAKYYFEDFLSVFQSREAFNNLGLVYYKMAAREYALWKPGTPGFALSLILDEKTRAKDAYAATDNPSPLKSALRKANPHKSRFDEYIAKAERYFTEAAQRDAAYALARNNLACALFMRERYSSAVGELDRAIELDPNLAETYNNRAAAYLKMAETMKIDLDAKAEGDFLKSIALRPGQPAALFNAAYFYHTRGKMAERNKYRDLLMAAEPESKLIGLLK
jgi:Zn-dependent protease with chaperone function